jgi:predicted RNA-binding protein YlxR (DUF448 family)
LPRARHVPERICTACGGKFPKRDLVRIVRSPEGSVAADPTGKSSGRGSYLCTAAACWERGLQRGSLERGLRTSLSQRDKDFLLEFYQASVSKTITVED